jgi:hypothetical protein
MTHPVCATCEAMRDQDALAVTTFVIEETTHNSCAPITHYTCRCKACNARWFVVEVFDEDGVRPSEWSWARDTPGDRSP